VKRTSYEAPHYAAENVWSIIIKYKLFFHKFHTMTKYIFE